MIYLGSTPRNLGWDDWILGYANPFPALANAHTSGCSCLVSSTVNPIPHANQQVLGYPSTAPDFLGMLTCYSLFQPISHPFWLSCIPLGTVASLSPATPDLSHLPADRCSSLTQPGSNLDLAHMLAYRCCSPV